MTPNEDDATATPPHGDPLSPHVPQDAGLRAPDDSSRSANDRADSVTPNRGPDAVRVASTDEVE